MSIKSEIQLLAPSTILDFFVLDSTNLPGGSKMYFHSGTNSLSQPVVWQGVTYTPLPIQAEGFDVTTKGATPRPKVKVANINGLLSASVKSMSDFVGCKFTRKRTFAKYLDAVNFPGNTNPTADPNQFIPDDIWYVERKLSENRYLIEFELSSAFDLMGVQLPNRQIIQNSCAWQYRDINCGWSGGYYDNNNNPTTVQANDVCAKTLGACKARFGVSPIRFGGFPGAVRGAK
jgi:lambda family phage minor tail protein L